MGKIGFALPLNQVSHLSVMFTENILVHTEMHSIKSTLTCWKISFSHMLNAVFTVFYKIYVLTYMTDAECNMFTLIFTCINWQMFTELVELLRKLHETFIALAAQLHQVHEAVKVRGTNAICTHIIEIIMCYQYIAQILNLLLLKFISVNKDLFATITSQFTGGKLVSSN